MVGGSADAAVTVVLAVWDAHVRYLGEALESVRAQVPAPRVVVVDNCSAEPVAVPGGVRLVRLARRVSVGAARTRGLQEVQTPLVVFWDADDVMPQGALAALGGALTADPRAVLACGRIVESGGAPHHWPRVRLTRAVAHLPAACAALSCVSSLVPAVGALLRTGAVRDAGGFPDLDAGDDWILSVALALRGRVCVTDRVTRIYRRHPAAMTVHGEGPGGLLANAAAVRRAVAADPAAPGWLVRGMPVLAVLQATVVLGARPLARAVRSRAR